MKNMFLGVLLIALLAVNSCKYSNEYKTVKGGEQFSLSLPSWLKEEENLKPGAQLQYANRYRNVYVIGEVVQPADVSVTMNANLNVLRKSMTSPLLTDSIPFEAGGLKGARVEIFGKMSGENIYFTEVLLQGDKAMYHLSAWTRGEERKLKFKEDITRIMTSFKEL